MENSAITPKASQLIMLGCSSFWVRAIEGASDNARFQGSMLFSASPVVNQSMSFSLAEPLGQRYEIDVRLNLRKRIAQRVDLSAVLIVSKQVRLDGGAFLHGGQARFFEVPC